MNIWMLELDPNFDFLIRYEHIVEKYKHILNSMQPLRGSK